MIQELNESSKLTKTLSGERPAGNVPNEAASSLGTCFVLELDPQEVRGAALSAGFQPIDELAKAYEKIPKRKRALVKAREWLADYSNEGRTLRTFRLKKGLSQAALAEKVSMTQAHIARLESGQIDAQMSTVLRLASALSVKPSTLFEALVVSGRTVQRR
jgi:DNA-binding XRE family transcriptional regulator